MNQPLANKPSEHSGSDPIEPVKLLMVEDDDFYYRLVSNILSTHHEPTFEVTRVSCLADAVKYLCLAASQIILLDLNLPDSAGLDTLLEVQKYSPGTPVIVLTGAEAHELGLRSIATGAADFLVKQKVGAESIVRCIRYAIERKKAEESRFQCHTGSRFANPYDRYQSGPRCAID
jgi:DNA-binding NtrC family response regulator